MSLIVPFIITTVQIFREHGMSKAADHIKREHVYIAQRLDILSSLFIKPETTVVINKKK